ncbi:MAG: hypothetical protein HONBIEJF_01930 [Fimbriimonadaceae bacterium]|nr:hypothetical protein [Fimbriimonadaceae bacterium]
MKFLVISSLVVGLIAGPLVMVSQAKPAFASKEKKACGYCHLRPSGGGARGFRGLYYRSNKLSFKGFDEKKEAEKAGVKPDAMGKDAKPTKPYPPKNSK